MRRSCLRTPHSLLVSYLTNNFFYVCFTFDNKKSYIYFNLVRFWIDYNLSPDTSDRCDKILECHAHHQCLTVNYMRAKSHWYLSVAEIRAEVWIKLLKQYCDDVYFLQFLVLWRRCQYLWGECMIQRGRLLPNSLSNGNRRISQEGQSPITLLTLKQRYVCSRHVFLT